MGKFHLPKKISKFTVIKLFLFSIFIFSGYYFFNSNDHIKSASDTEGEVLQATSVKPVEVFTINNYVMKNVIREDCKSVQPYMDFFCEVGTAAGIAKREPTFGVTNVNKFNTYVNSVNEDRFVDAGIEYYGNPVLEDISGVPLLSFYGGFYEIVLDTNPQRVVNIARPFKTENNRYTPGCLSSWSPSSIAKKGNTILFGSGGLEPFVENRCFEQNQGAGAGEFGTSIRGDVECKNRAVKLGMPLKSGCKPSRTVSCWDTSFQCKTFTGSKMYYNVPFITRFTFSKRAPDSLGATLFVSGSGGAKAVAPSGGSASRDARAYCYGKTKNDCSRIMAEIEYGDDKAVRCWETGCNSHGTDDAGVRKYINYGIVKKNDGSNRKSFYNRVFYGFNEVFQDTTDLRLIFGGYDTPASAYNLPNRVDFFQVYQTSGQKNSWLFKYRISNFNFTPAPNILGYEVFPTPINVRNGVLDDFVSDKYYFTLQYIDNTLFFKRFQVTGYLSNQRTIFGAISLPGVNLSYTRNITFSINSSDDIDIMIAPNFKDSKNNRNAQTKMFRAQNFNSSSGPYRLYELNESNGGYKFPSTDPVLGNNAPLTFRYYNNTDADTANDFAVFVSRNYVFSSKIPVSTPTTPTTPEVCIPNFNVSPNGGLSLTNINSNSKNNGITPDNYRRNTTYDLNFRFNQQVALNCPSGVVNLPAGTDFSLTLYDGISSQVITPTFPAELGADRRTVEFLGVATPNFKKYFYRLSFVYNGNTYFFPANGVDNSRFYTLEGNFSINTYLDNADTDPLDEPKFSISKIENNVPTILDGLTAPSNFFDLNSQEYPSFFWDHNMGKTGTSLTDRFTYRLCMKNSADMRITKIRFTGQPNTESNRSLSNSFLNATIDGNCLNFNYKFNTATSYNLIPQEIDIFVTSTGIRVPSTYLNFRVNGNIMMKNSVDVKMYETSVASEKKYQGVYVSPLNQGNLKFYKGLPTLFNNHFKLPYTSGITSGINLEYVENLSTPALTNYLLVSNKNSNTGSSLDSIDVLKTFTPSGSPTIVFVAKNKQLVFDLKDDNLTNSLENIYFISADSDNPRQRIVFKVDCSDLNNYSLICSNNNSYHFKGGFYGDMKLEGNLNTTTSNRTFININQNPEILLDLQVNLRSIKIFNITRSKTVYKYLNN